MSKRRKVEERVEEIRNCPTWKLGWNNHMSEVIYRGLMEKLDSHGIPEEEVNDILSVALFAALTEGKQR